MDLTPRPAAAAPARRPRSRRTVLSVALLVVVLVAGGIIVAKFLTSSLDYYCNADEVGVKDGCEAGRRLRIQGTVDEGSFQAADGVSHFSISFNGVSVPVVYDSAQPGGLFQECIPVVIHGRLQGGVFEGDDIEVKHSNEYEEKNPDRVEGSESPACSQRP